MPILMYVCTVAVAGLLAFGFFLLGKMTREEAVSYMFLSQYPRRWFATNAGVRAAQINR